MLALHHIVADGWSLGVLADELGALYGAYREGGRRRCRRCRSSTRTSPPGSATSCGASGCAGRRELLAGGAAAICRRSSCRPTAPGRRRCRTAARGGRSRSRAAQVDRLRSIGRAGSATLFMTLLAAFQTLLVPLHGTGRLRRRRRPSPTAARPEIERADRLLRRTRSCCATDAADDPTFRELLDAGARTAARRLRSPGLPVRAARRGRSHRRATSAAIRSSRSSSPRRRRGGADPAARRRRHRGADAGVPSALRSRVPLSRDRRRQPRTGVIDYATDLFDAGTIERLAGHLERLIDGDRRCARMTPISALPLLPDAERRQLLVDWATAPAEYPREATPRRTLRGAGGARRPTPWRSRPATRALTYARARRAGEPRSPASCTRRAPVPRRRVGALPRPRARPDRRACSRPCKAGAAYVPLDPDVPAGARWPSCSTTRAPRSC